MNREGIAIKGDRPFSGSYDPDDVIFLLKPVKIRPTAIDAKERAIQSGRRHYSEMIPREFLPDPAYLALYDDALARNAQRLARDIADLAGALANHFADRREVVIASLVRAGTPIGILVKRALCRLGIDAYHYSLSIVRDRGIDLQALRHIAARHDSRDTVFVDGWIGKGVIATELRHSLADRPLGFSPFLAVVADPAGQADLAATSEDYLIPSGILNAIVSGLVSRSILSAALVGPGDFHACVHHRQLARYDLSQAFIERIDAFAHDHEPRPITQLPADRRAAAKACQTLLRRISQTLGIDDMNRIKPGIAEATRALLRRRAERVLLSDEEDLDTRHLIHLARNRGLPIEPMRWDSPYRAVTIIGAVEHGRRA